MVAFPLQAFLLAHMAVPASLEPSKKIKGVALRNRVYNPKYTAPRKYGKTNYHLGSFTSEIKAWIAADLFDIRRLGCDTSSGDLQSYLRCGIGIYKDDIANPAFWELSLEGLADAIKEHNDTPTSEKKRRAKESAEGTFLSKRLKGAQAADAGVLIEVRNDKPAQIPLALRPEISDISMQITRSPVDPLLSTSVAGSPSSSTVQAAQQEIDTEQYSPCLTMLLGQSLKECSSAWIQPSPEVSATASEETDLEDMLLGPNCSWPELTPDDHSLLSCTAASSLLGMPLSELC